MTKRKKGALHMLLIVLGAYVLLCAVGCAWQRRMIYFPTRLDSDVAKLIAAKEGFAPWENTSGAIIGWKLTAELPAAGTVLIVHGNAGSAIDRGYFADPIHDAASVDVYILEYPGYGAREGAPSQKTFLAAADEAIALLDQSGPLYLVSESLGTGVAAHLAKMHPNKVAGLALFAPYNDFKSLAQAKMPFLPVSLILLDRYDPATWLKDYSGPVKVVVAENDEIIPAKFGRQLYDGYRGAKDLQIIPNARHNDIAAQSAEWWQNVFSFWQENGPAKLKQ